MVAEDYLDALADAAAAGVELPRDPEFTRGHKIPSAVLAGRGL